MRYKKWKYDGTKNRIDFGFYDKDKFTYKNAFILNTLAMNDGELSGSGLRRGDVINGSDQIPNVNNNVKGSSSTKYNHDHLPVVFDLQLK